MVRMHRSFLALAAWLALAPQCLAKPLDAALQQQLLGLYASYNQALTAGKLTDALKLRSAETRATARKQMPNDAARQRFLAMAKSMVPDAVEPVHASINAAGNKASIITVATRTIPKNAKVPPGGPAPGSTMHGEVTLTYVKENDGWKLDDQMFGPDPASIAACKDESYEPEAAYDSDKTVSMGGPVVRVDFQPDHTLVVIRVVDEENCAFLQDNKDELLKHGLDPANLVPYAIVELEGSPHKSKKQKVLVDSLTVPPED
jgi:hypothetical protein